MDAPTKQLPWDQPGWLDEAAAWIHRELAKCGWTETGPLEVIHQRAWSTLARIPAQQGVAYFKAPAPPFFEIGLTELLSQRWPENTLSVLAADAQRGWLLTRDGGPILREAVPDLEQVEHWVKLLPLYADIQMDMAGSVPQMIHLGMFDRRLATFPDLYAELMEAHENLRVGIAARADARRIQKLA